MSKEIHQIRQSYHKHHLLDEAVQDDPITQFKQWFDAALQSTILEPNAMTLSTATADGKVSARMMLMKDFGERGFTFFSNYHSRKGEQLTSNAFAAITFWWYAQERQVRIEGRVQQLEDEEADKYFHSRPRGSQIGAWTSPQSKAIPDRKFLDKQFEEVEQRFTGKEIPRPEYWQGFLLVPERIEFWQGRPNRLHDRIEYLRQEDKGWHIQRLAP